MFKKEKETVDEPEAPAKKPKVEEHAYEDSWYRALKAKSERRGDTDEDDEQVEGSDD